MATKQTKGESSARRRPRALVPIGGPTFGKYAPALVAIQRALFADFARTGDVRYRQAFVAARCLAHAMFEADRGDAEDGEALAELASTLDKRRRSFQADCGTLWSLAFSSRGLQEAIDARHASHGYGRAYLAAIAKASSRIVAALFGGLAHCPSIVLDDARSTRDRLDDARERVLKNAIRPALDEEPSALDHAEVCKQVVRAFLRGIGVPEKRVREAFTTDGKKKVARPRDPEVVH